MLNSVIELTSLKDTILNSDSVTASRSPGLSSFRKIFSFHAHAKNTETFCVQTLLILHHIFSYTLVSRYPQDPSRPRYFLRFHFFYDKDTRNNASHSNGNM